MSERLPEAEAKRADELLAEYGDASDGGWQEEIADALLRKGVALAWHLERPEEGIAAWDLVYARYASAEGSELREAVNWALMKKALVLVELRRPGDAFPVYREVLARRLPGWGPASRTLLAAGELAAVWLAVKLRLQGPASKLELWARENLVSSRNAS